MPNTINGTGKPRFTVVHTDNSWIADYNFPRCNINGFQQGHTKDNIVHTKWMNKGLIQKVNGYRYRYILDYSQLLIGDYCLELRELLNYELQGYKIKFTAHVDSLNIVDEVILSNAEILLRLLPSGSGEFKAMQDIVIEMLSIELKPINWIDTTNLTHVFTNFAMAN